MFYSVLDVEDPYCHATNVKKITNTSKAVHTAIFGIFFTLAEIQRTSTVIIVIVIFKSFKAPSFKISKLKYSIIYSNFNVAYRVLLFLQKICSLYLNLPYCDKIFLYFT